MALQLRLLDGPSMQDIQERALGILESVGVKFGSEAACRKLEDLGATVDWQQLSARIPRSLVEVCINNAPMDFTLAAPDGQHDIYTGDPRPWYTSGGPCKWIRDEDSGRRRLATRADLVNCVKMVSSMGTIDEWCSMLAPSDVPREISDLVSLETSLRYSTKHFIYSGIDPAHAGYERELLDLYLGDYSDLGERPVFTHALELTAPLQINGDMLNSVLRWADLQVPVLLQFLPLSGSTAPATLAGTIVQETASFLGLITLLQTVSPGWPLIWGADAGVTDVTTGQHRRISAEAVLMEICFVQLAKELYEIPASVFSYGTEAKSLDFIAGLESAITTPLVELAGADNVRGIAELDGGSLIDLDFVVISQETILWMERFREGVNLNPDRFQTDLITKMGFNADYLRHRDSKQLTWDEQLEPDLFPPVSYDEWQQMETTERAIARSRVRQLIADYEEPEHPDEVIKGAEAILKRAQDDLG